MFVMKANVCYEGKCLLPIHPIEM